MLDPRLIRETPETVRAAIAKKHLDADLDAVLALDTAWRSLLTEVESLRSKQKAANTEMVALKKGSPEFLAKVQEMKAVSVELKAKDDDLKLIGAVLEAVSFDGQLQAEQPFFCFLHKVCGVELLAAEQQQEKNNS